MSFIQDPRLRQRWNQITHDAEAVTENAAAGIWTFQHKYITPCLSSIADSIDSCTAVCIGDREERARRARERDRGARRTRAEYTFDFYDDWADDFADDEGIGGSSGSGGGLLGSWGGGRSEDWDRLLAGTGSSRKHQHADPEGGVVNQPRRKRGMSYGTRGVAGSRRRSGVAAEEEDPTIIPSTAPLGFLGRLPFKIGGTLRYKPSAANLRDHPGTAGAANDTAKDHQKKYHQREESEPLLGTSDEEYEDRERSPQSRPRSNTAGSGDTSDSYRSRGDLFPSDGEGDEDAIPLDDEFAVALDRVDDRSSNRTRSSKGKRPDNNRSLLSRTVSRTTISSTHSRNSARSLSHSNHGIVSYPVSSGDAPSTPSLEDLQREEEQAEREEAEEIERRRKAASELALKRGLSRDSLASMPGCAPDVVSETKSEISPVDEVPEPSLTTTSPTTAEQEEVQKQSVKEPKSPPPAPAPQPAAVIAEHKAEPKTVVSLGQEGFVPARLPHFR